MPLTHTKPTSATVTPKATVTVTFNAVVIWGAPSIPGGSPEGDSGYVIGTGTDVTTVTT